VLGTITIPDASRILVPSARHLHNPQQSLLLSVRKENRKQRDEVANDVEEEVNNNTPQLGLSTKPNSVSLEGHVEQDLCIKGPRRSNRQRTINVQLRNYVG